MATAEVKRNIGVAAVGDVLNINTWSNIPYYFYSAGARAGLFNQPWRFNPHELKRDRLFWNALRLLTLQGKGGYQYSNRFLRKAETLIDHNYFSSTVISFNQLFPRAASVQKAGGRMFYYIDVPLFELFASEHYRVDIPESMKRTALDQEQENYQKAEAVVCMGTWVMPRLKEFYHLPDHKIIQVLPGANIGSTHSPDRKSVPGAGRSRPLRLGFIGKDWRRKGLAVLVDVAEKLKAKNVDCRIVIIGNSPAAFKKHPLVEDLGFIDKTNEPGKFMNAVASCDLGCIFSSAEALGISALEFLSCQVPVTGFYHQGMIDTLIEGASVRFAPSDTTDHIADTIARLVNDEERTSDLYRNAGTVSSRVTWDACIEKWRDIIR